jgi:hypothetical protein
MIFKRGLGQTKIKRQIGFLAVRKQSSRRIQKRYRNKRLPTKRKAKLENFKS